jgi:chromosome segregation ATPase
MAKTVPANNRTAAERAADAAAAIRRAADAATEKLAVLKADLAARDAELERLREVCDERRRIIDELTGHAATYRQAAEERAGLVASLHADVQRLRQAFEREREELQATCDQLQATCEERMALIERAETARAEALAAAEAARRALEEERARARFELGQRDAQLREAERVADEVSSRLPVLNDALEARARLIEELQATCDERLALIEKADRARSDAQTAAESAQRALEAERARARFELGQRDAELREAERVAAEVGARVPVLSEALDQRARLIEQLQATCDERLAAMERLAEESAMLRVVAEERALLIETNEAKYQAREAQLAAVSAAPADGIDWRAIAEERERALQELAGEAERRAVLLADVTAALEGRTREVEDLRKRHTSVS